MPSDWLYIDTNFPAFTGVESLSDKVTTIQNYMFMLVEQMRYTLHNLDFGKNMNPASLGRFTQPIYGRIGDAEGNLTELAVTAQGLQSRVSDAEGRITSLTQTVDGFALYAGNSQTGRSSYIYLTSGGIVMSSAVITFSGLVLFTDLSQSGGTVINGGNIKTGVITAMKMSGNEIIGGTVTGATLRSVSSSDNGFEIYYGAVTPSLLVGGIRFDDTGSGPNEAKYRMFIYTNSPWAMKLRSAAGISVETGGLIYISATSEVSINAPAVRINGKLM